MRSHLLAAVSAALLLVASTSHADEPANANDDASFGTRPAKKGGAPQAAPTKAVPAPAEAGVATDDVIEDQKGGFAQSPRQYRQYEAPIAADPPGDWAVLHAGLRPHLGTFGGIATFAVAHARTESWYGGFSLSGIRNDAGTHIGGAQIALGRNLSDTFGGGMQVSLSENRARHFYGIGQLSLAYNRTQEMIGVAQLGSYNRSSEFSGLVQVAPYNRTDKTFNGIAEVGAFNHSRGQFNGLVQLGVVNGTGEELYSEKDTYKRNHFAGIAQAGFVNANHGDFYGIAQIGVQSITSRDFVGVAQIGGLGVMSGKFKGLVQSGGLVSFSKESYGIQVGGGAIALESHTGLQVGAGTYGKTVDGAQVGVVNLSDKVRGLQIGVFNHTKSLRGVQIGLANHADDGVLPWTAILNMGFGDDPNERVYEQDDEEYRSKQQYKAARR